MNMVNQVANPETKRGPLPGLDWLKRPDFGNVAKFAGTIGVAAAIMFGGAVEAGAKEETTDIVSGPRIQLVCAYPKDQPSCDTARVQKAGQGLEAFMGNPNNGYSGLSFRIAMEGGNYGVVPVQLDATTAEIVNKAYISEKDPNAPNNLQDYMVNQIHQKAGNDHSVEYATFLTNTPPLGSIGTTIGPARVWNGMNVPYNGVNRNVMTTYLNQVTDNPTSYHGFRSGDVYMAASLLQNEGLMRQCQPNFAGNGYSLKPDNLLSSSLSIPWWELNIGTDYLKSTPNCAGLDVVPRMDWQVNTLGKGAFKFFSRDGGGNLVPTALDPGNRLPAGGSYEAQYVPAKGERLAKFIGSCTNANTTEVCDFVANQPITVQAQVQETAPPPTTTTTTTRPPTKKVYELRATAEGPMHIRYLGKLVKVVDKMFKKGTVVRINYVLDNKNSAIGSILGCDNAKLHEAPAKKTGICDEIIGNETNQKIGNRNIEIIAGKALKVPVVSKYAG